MPGRAAAWHPPILQGNEQSRKMRTGWRRARTTDSLFLFFYSAKPISEILRLFTSIPFPLFLPSLPRKALPLYIPSQQIYPPHPYKQAT